MSGRIPVRDLRLKGKMATMAVVALTMAGAIAATPAVAGAQSLWVSHAPTVAGNGKGCTKPGFDAVQAAISAAPSGATIQVCAGTYEEQLQITQPVNLKAAGAATVKLPATPANSTSSCGQALSATTQAVVDICGSGTVKISGVNVEGGWPSSTCNDNLYDILVGSGANLKLTNSSVLGAGDSPINGCQGGVGVQVGSHHGSQAGTASLQNDTINGYQKNGVTVDGSGSSATIKNTTVVGAGPTNVIAQNGIQVSRGAVAKITSSSITGDQYSGESTAATGIIFYQAANGSKITNSTISNDDIGIDFEESGTSQLSVSGSKFDGNRYTSLYILEGSVSIKKSTMNGGEDGIDLYQFASENAGAAGTATSDTIENMSSYAVVGFSDKEPTDPGGTFRVIKSKISGNPAGASVAESVFSESPSLTITTENDS
jgi:hypothetical protein